MSTGLGGDSSGPGGGADSAPILRMAQTIDRRAKFSLSIPWYIYFETAKRKKSKKI